MKQSLITIMLALTVNTVALAAESLYTIRVDGLACPYCAYGIEKKLKAVDGVSDIKVDLDAGLVSLKAADGVTLGDEQMKTLFQDAGFTYRSMKKTTPVDETKP